MVSAAAELVAAAKGEIVRYLRARVGEGS